MSLDQLLNVSVTRETRTASREGFGTPLLAASHAVTGPLVQAFGSLSAAETAGFTAAAEPFVHRQLSIGFAQNPRPALIKVGKRQNVSAQTVQIVPLNLVEGVEYQIAVNGTATSFTVGAAATTAAVVTGLQAVLDAVSGVTATDDTTHVTLTATVAAERFWLDGVQDCALTDTTTDGGIAADLAALNAVDSGWYGLVIDGQGELENNAAATWVEANDKLFAASSSDAGVPDDLVSDDLASDVVGAAYARTGVLVRRRGLGDGYAIGLMAQGLTEDPMVKRLGQKKSWAHRTIAALAVDSFSEAEMTTLRGKRATYYVSFAGLNLTFEGTTGAGEFFDIPQFVDAFRARLQERMASVFANQEIQFTSQGQGLIEGNLRDVVNQGIRAGQLAQDPEPVVTVPAPLDLSAVDRAARRWTGIEITARLSGAAHGAELSVLLTV